MYYILIKLPIKILSKGIYLISKRKIIVNTIAWTINPNIVGQPSLFAIGPTREDNKLWTNLYIHGLNKIKRSTVVYKVNLHLSELDGSVIIGFLVAKLFIAYI
jgi:hypothetical protein